jgi:ABC-type antimicrobial peptide transport system permease subunit
VLRSSAPPGSLTAAVRAQLDAVDPAVPIFSVLTMEEQISRTLQFQRVTNLLLTCFAAIALLLAAAGIYGVMSLEVSSRVQEFGIRIALGANSRNVFALVCRKAMWLTAAGVMAGLLGALLATRVVASMLFEVQTTDALTYTMAAAVLAAVAFAACAFPALRATRVDPNTALHYE